MVISVENFSWLGAGFGLGVCVILPREPDERGLPSRQMPDLGPVDPSGAKIKPLSERPDHEN